MAVRIIHNTEFQNTNVSYSIGLALQANINNNILIIYGDLVFNTATLRDVTIGKSKLLVDTQGNMKDEEVGIVSVNNYVTHMAYDLDTKWKQIVFLREKENRKFEEIAVKNKTRKWFGYEVINEIIDSGGLFESVENIRSVVMEIDTYKDLQKIQQKL